jgi:Skp family chaperone for outer membrane proteins
MVRWSVFAGCLTVVAGAAFVTGATTPTSATKPPLPLDAKADAAKVVVVGQKTGYFNIAKIIRESTRAKTATDRVKTLHTRMASNIVGMRAMYIDLQTALPKVTDANKRFDMERDMRNLARKIEDLDRVIMKEVNDRADAEIVAIHDDLRAVVKEVAQDNTLAAVIAYPDATNENEEQSTAVKQLRLKPPAAQPFYVDASADFTDEILRRMNEKFAAREQ